MKKESTNTALRRQLLENEGGPGLPPFKKKTPHKGRYKITSFMATEDTGLDSEQDHSPKIIHCSSQSLD